MESTHAEEKLYKFPRTRHLFDAGGGVGRDDLLMDKHEVREFLKNKITIEEKVDGANLGISLTPDYQLTFQNRSHYVTSQSATQWKGLDNWISQHPGIFQFLTPDLVLFGEWLYAKHSIHYTELPSYFMAFDIYNKKEDKFLSVAERDLLLKDTGIPTVRQIDQGNFTIEKLKELLNQKSSFYDGPIEGIYLRIDDDKYLKQRAKVVRHDFLEKGEDNEVEHWSKKQLVKNTVKY